MSMKDVVKLSTQMRWLSPLSWCLCVVEHCHIEGRHYQLARFSTFRLSALRPYEREFKRQTLYQWWESENCSDEVAQRTVNRILWSWDTCSLSKLEQCYLEKHWLCWEVRMWSIEDQLHFYVLYMFLCQ